MPAMNPTHCMLLLFFFTEYEVAYHISQCHVVSSSISSARRSKTNISLVPRAVARGRSESAPGNQQASSGTGDGEPAMARMSNDDFRKLLSKN